MPGRINLFDKIRLIIAVIKQKIVSHDLIFINISKDFDVVDRIEFILGFSKSKRLLHFGFLDTPFLEKKVLSSNMLHAELKKVAEFLFGVDINARDLEAYRSLTHDCNNCLLDISEKDIDLNIIDKYNFDIVLLPEVLEHIMNPGLALANIYKICKKSGAKLIVTVPNAFNLSLFINAANGVEVVHPEHYFYFSPVTIRKLLQDSGFDIEKLNMYTSKGNHSYPGITQWGIICVCGVRS
jgi:SAM-dependent methyltransferase